MEYQDTIFAKEGHVATITLNRPQRRNAITTRMADEIMAALRDIEEDEEVRALVLTGADPGFCTGADVESLAAVAGGQPLERTTKRQALPQIYNDFTTAIHRLRKPTIAAVNGICAGAGLGVAFCCDIRIGSENARFSSVFVRRGVCPDMGTTWFLPRLVGTARACLLAFTGDIIDAREAERIGLLAQVVPHQELLPTTMALARKIADGPPIAIELTKKALYQGLSSSLEAHLAAEFAYQRIAFATEDFKEGVRSFLEKREPRFQGR